MDKPYGYVRADGIGLFIYGEQHFTNNLNHDLMPVYTHPKEWVGLTNEDCEEVERWVEFKEEGSGRIPMQKLARYIEARLKEKNT
jgi:hypothetical protein